MNTNMLVGFSLGFSLAVALVALTACSPAQATIPPLTGPHHAGPNAWHVNENAERQVFCRNEVLKIARQVGAVDADVAELKRIYWVCLKQVGATI